MVIYDAFSDKVNKGNRTALVKAAGLSTGDMQGIAKKLGFAETLFYQGLTLRYFSPEEEIDFCGHATLAFAWSRGQEEKRVMDILQTPVGEIPIYYSYNGENLEKVWMLQASLQVKEILFDQQELCDALGIDLKDIDTEYPLKASYTGNWDIFVPLKSEEIIDGISPWLASAMSLVLFGMIFSTGAGMFYAFVTRFVQMGTPAAQRFSVATLVLGFIASFAGFTQLVAFFYPLIGYLGLFLVFALIIAPFKLKREAGQSQWVTGSAD